MINLIIDTNNLFFRSLYIVGGYGSKNYTFDNNYEVEQLIRKLATDVSFIIRQTNPSRVIATLDSKSWRKNISIDENDGYKAHRVKSSVINWDNVFDILREFTEILESIGFVVSRVDNAEADDLITLWRDELLFNQKQHVIMVSSDEDVRQLVRAYNYENGSVYSTVLNPFTSGKSSKKLFVPKNFDEWLNTDEGGDIFNRAIDVDKEDFSRLKNSQIVFEEVDGDHIALKKVFCGDDGDNVPAIFSWITKTAKGEDKTVRITNAKFLKIIDSAKVSFYSELEDKADFIYEQIVSISGQRPPFDMVERLKRQIKLVVLARGVFPEKIVETFDEELEEHLKKSNIHPQEWNMNSILEGTKYVSAVSSKNIGNEASIFKEVDRLNKELF